MRSTIILSVSLVISLIGCVVLACFYIDQTISLFYMGQECHLERISARDLQYLLLSEWKGMPEDKLQAKLERIVNKAPKEYYLFVKKDEEEDIIWVDQIPFNIKNGKLESIGGENQTLK